MNDIEVMQFSENTRMKNLTIEEIGDDHIFTSLETPMKPTAFSLSDAEKKDKIADLFSQIMDVLGLDL